MKHNAKEPELLVGAEKLVRRAGEWLKSIEWNAKNRTRAAIIAGGVALAAMGVIGKCSGGKAVTGRSSGLPGAVPTAPAPAPKPRTKVPAPGKTPASTASVPVPTPAPSTPGAAESCPENVFALYKFDKAKVTAPWLWLLTEARKRGWEGNLDGPRRGIRNYAEQKLFYDCSTGKAKRDARTKEQKRKVAEQCAGVGKAFNPDSPKAMHVDRNVMRKGEWSQAVDLNGDEANFIRIAKQLGVELDRPYLRSSNEKWHVEAAYSFAQPESFRCPAPINPEVLKRQAPKADDDLAGEERKPAGANSAENGRAAEKNSAPSFDIIGQAERGRALLKDIRTGNNLAEEGKQLDDFNVVLAARNNESTTVKYVTLKPGGKTTDGYEIKKGEANGVNTPYQISVPEGHFVLAIKRAIYNSNHDGYREVVYTPYSPALDTPEIRKKGLEYLNSLIAGGKEALRKKNIGSAARSGVQAADTIPDDVLTVLTMIEHIDKKDVVRDGHAVEALMERMANRVLATSALNKDLAYDYSVSLDGARGLFQVMPETYFGTRRNYPLAGLDEDVVRGLTNEKNGVQAQILLTDHDLGSLLRTEQTFKDLYNNNPAQLGRFLASIYNTGFPNWRSAYRKDPKNWLVHVPGDGENQFYVVKYDMVMKLLREGRLGK